MAHRRAALEHPPELILGSVDADVDPIAYQLHKAAATGNKKSARKALDHGMKVDFPNNEGQSPLFIAAYEGKMDMIDLLLGEGANPNARSNAGQTAMHAACAHGTVLGMSKMMEHGGDLRLHDDNNHKPHDFAFFHQDRKKRKDLLEYMEKARLFAMTGSGRDILMEHQSETYLARSVGSAGSVAKLFDKKSQSNESVGKKSSKMGFESIYNFMRGTGSAQSLGFGTIYVGKQPGAVSTIPLIPDTGLVHDEYGLTYNNGAFMVMESMFWDKTHVTVKRLHHNPANGGVVDLLIQESDFAGHLRHPNILLMMGLCQTHNLDGIVLLFERVRFGSVFVFLHERMEQLSLTAIVSIMMQIADALVYIHSRGIVHCSITSHAVQLVGPNLAKISNFEYTVNYRDPDDEASQQWTAMKANKMPNAVYNWMAPEIMVDGFPSEESDMYSFCSVMWEMLRGEMPWSGMDADTIKTQVVDKQRMLPTDGFPEILCEILTYGLSSDPHDRKINFEEMRDLLQSIPKINDCPIPQSSDCIWDKLKILSQTTTAGFNNHNSSDLSYIGDLFYIQTSPAVFTSKTLKLRSSLRENCKHSSPQSNADFSSTDTSLNDYPTLDQLDTVRSVYRSVDDILEGQATNDTPFLSLSPRESQKDLKQMSDQANYSFIQNERKRIFFKDQATSPGIAMEHTQVQTMPQQLDFKSPIRSDRVISPTSKTTSTFVEKPTKGMLEKPPIAAPRRSITRSHPTLKNTTPVKMEGTQTEIIGMCGDVQVVKEKDVTGETKELDAEKRQISTQTSSTLFNRKNTEHESTVYSTLSQINKKKAPRFKKKMSDRPYRSPEQPTVRASITLRNSGSSLRSLRSLGSGGSINSESDLFKPASHRTSLDNMVVRPGSKNSLGYASKDKEKKTIAGDDYVPPGKPQNTSEETQCCFRNDEEAQNFVSENSECLLGLSRSESKVGSLVSKFQSQVFEHKMKQAVLDGKRDIMEELEQQQQKASTPNLRSRLKGLTSAGVSDCSSNSTKNSSSPDTVILRLKSANSTCTRSPIGDAFPSLQIQNDKSEEIQPKSKGVSKQAVDTAEDLSIIPDTACNSMDAGNSACTSMEARCGSPETSYSKILLNRMQSDSYKEDPYYYSPSDDSSTIRNANSADNVSSDGDHLQQNNGEMLPKGIMCNKFIREDSNASLKLEKQKNSSQPEDFYIDDDINSDWDKRERLQATMSLDELKTQPKSPLKKKADVQSRSTAYNQSINDNPVCTSRASPRKSCSQSSITAPKLSSPLKKGKQREAWVHLSPKMHSTGIEEATGNAEVMNKSFREQFLETYSKASGCKKKDGELGCGARKKTSAAGYDTKVFHKKVDPAKELGYANTLRVTSDNDGRHVIKHSRTNLETGKTQTLREETVFASAVQTQLELIGKSEEFI